MADVTISGLSDLAPTGSIVVPVSDGSNTGKAMLSALPVAYSNVTGKPNVTVSTVAGPPSNATGTDGDIYYQVAA